MRHAKTEDLDVLPVHMVNDSVALEDDFAHIFELDFGDYPATFRHFRQGQRLVNQTGPQSP